jgi:hypothetical protein
MPGISPAFLPKLSVALLAAIVLLLGIMPDGLVTRIALGLR